MPTSHDEPTFLQSILNLFRSEKTIRAEFEHRASEEHKARLQRQLEKRLLPEELICNDGTKLVKQLVLEPDEHYLIFRNGELLHTCTPAKVGSGINWSFRNGGSFMMGLNQSAMDQYALLSKCGSSFLLVAREGNENFIRLGDQLIKTEYRIVNVQCFNERDLIYVLAINDESKRTAMEKRMNSGGIYHVYRFGVPDPICVCEDLPQITQLKDEGVFTVVSYTFQEFPLTAPPVQEDESSAIGVLISV